MNNLLLDKVYSFIQVATFSGLYCSFEEIANYVDELTGVKSLTALCLSILRDRSLICVECFGDDCGYVVCDR